MAKYSFEFKKKVVTAYLDGDGGYNYLAKKIGVPAVNNVKKWIISYQKFGDEGLLRSRQKKSYSFEDKLRVVELYLSSEVSYQELALQEGINNPAGLSKLQSTSTHSIFVYNSRATLAPWNFLNGINNNTAITQNIKGVTYRFLTSHFKNIKRHSFPFHFMNYVYVTRIHCFTKC